MKTAWPLVPLGNVVEHRKEFITIDDLTTYRRPRVQLHAQGIVLRDALLGAEIKTKKQQVARVGEFLVAEIDAKVGGFGIVPHDLDGAIVSSHYFLYRNRAEYLDNRYLGWFVRTRAFRHQVEAQGSTNYAAIRPTDVLGYKIPLPSLDEQRRIVTRIQELATKVKDARALRLTAKAEAEALSRSATDSVYKRLVNECGLSRLAAACTSITDGDHQTPAFSEVGVKFIFVGNVSTGRLHFKGVKYVAPQYFQGLSERRVPRPGDLLYSAVGATLGIPAVVNVDDDFCFQRHVAILKPDRAKASPTFLWHMLKSKTVFDKAWASTTGSAQPTIPLRAIRELPIPLPPLDRQAHVVNELDALHGRIDSLKALQDETAAELDAMLPAILDKAFKGEL
jgi:type I restriction enzyme, S subunit